MYQMPDVRRVLLAAIACCDLCHGKSTCNLLCAAFSGAKKHWANLMNGYEAQVCLILPGFIIVITNFAYLFLGSYDH